MQKNVVIPVVIGPSYIFFAHTLGPISKEYITRTNYYSQPMAVRSLIYFYTVWQPLGDNLSIKVQLKHDAYDRLWVHGICIELWDSGGATAAGRVIMCVAMLSAFMSAFNYELNCTSLLLQRLYRNINCALLDCFNCEQRAASTCVGLQRAT